jgi:hypothetical protein
MSEDLNLQINTTEIDVRSVETSIKAETIKNYIDIDIDKNDINVSIEKKQINVQMIGGSSSSGGGGAVDSVNGKVGVVVLNPDDLDDSTTSNKFVTDAEKSTWNSKQDSLIVDIDYLSPITASGLYEPKKGNNDNYVTDLEKTVIGNTSGTNTGDQVGDGVTITGAGTLADPFVSIGGGVSTFDALTDTPASKIGKAGYAVVVNVLETALEYVTSVQAFDGGSFGDTNINTINFDGGSFV